MFGFLTANSALLTQEQELRYRACYCGLCRSLRKSYGELAGFLLTYDMTFLILLLSSLYEPEETGGDRACLIHCRDPRPWQHSLVTDYAADMTVALSYHKSLDGWRDDHNPMSLAVYAALKSAYRVVEQRWPRQCAGIENGIQKLLQLEQSGENDPDAAAAFSGAMLAEVFSLQEDRWAPALRRLGDGIGRTIYLLDAAVDLEEDLKKGRYNPLEILPKDAWTRERLEEIIKIYLSESVHAFDFLPLVNDSELMKNILCVGLWQQFDKKFGNGSDPADGNVSGSV